MKKLWNLFLFLSWMGMIAPAAGQGLNLNLSLPNSHGASVLIIDQDSSTSIRSRLGEWRAYDHCYGTATVIFGHSAHPGGDRGGRLNQDNGGNGGRCYLNPEKTTYGIVAGLTNSQYGGTLIFALGKRWPFLQLDTEFLRAAHIPIDRVTLFVGAEAGSLYYEKYYGRGAVLAPFVFPNIAASVHIGKIEITAMQVFLIDGIKLWGQVVDVPYSMGGNGMPYSTPYFDSPANAHRTKSTPMLFLSYRF